ncbi:hypothetical protein GCM10011608_09870 [Micromonospora sonchi]|uniref:Uncharacterized protein n=1 Tax=Micromonospora sonchi TaxID=1763543 RepID=A0A917WTP1_9ACTN|nr:hypothetical protein [Micromonospora sonchi]GGM27107.1 hypothetical protein GCM10011608_09870 [Micromonospora sonchi]
MASLAVAEANRLLDASLGTAGHVAPTPPMTLALITAAGDGVTPGTEVVGGSYERQPVTFGAASAGEASNSTPVVFAGMPAVTVVGVEVYDSADPPRRCWHGPLTAQRTVQNGDAVQFAVGQIVATIT